MLIALDVLIFGGGAAGLWLLDELRRLGYAVLLLESGYLGSGQTIASQGIIHGGLKYTLDGMFNPSADAIRDMPEIWRACLRGDRLPDLRNVRLRGEYCHLWRTQSLASRFGMIGARAGLRVAPVKLAREERPPPLRGCPGDVFRLDEQVIDPRSLLNVLHNQNRAFVRRFDAERGLEFVQDARGELAGVRLRRPPPAGDDWADLYPRAVVFAAGAGNAALRQRAGLAADAMQRRPLHMVMLRGTLPTLNGHCTDASRTRVTITSDTDAGDRTIWQVGGQVAEDGVRLNEAELRVHARDELLSVLPNISLDGVEWASYRVDRAEAATGSGARPADVAVLRERNIITAWPTKLALAPRLAEKVIELLDPPRGEPLPESQALSVLKSTGVARPPWEKETQWFSVP